MLRLIISSVVIIILMFWGTPAMADDALEQFITQHIANNRSGKIVVQDQEELYKKSGKKLLVNDQYFKTLAIYICESAEASGTPALKITAVAQLESGFDVTAKNGTCLGWFQIKPRYHEKKMIELGFGAFDNNPKGQCMYAGWKMSQGGSNAWEVWSKGTAKRLYQKMQGAYNAKIGNIGNK
jgi:hypothetical protein